jgi:hypothetical protein
LTSYYAPDKTGKARKNFFFFVGVPNSVTLLIRWDQRHLTLGGHVHQFLPLKVFDAFSTGAQNLVKLDAPVLHTFVRIVRTSDQNEVLSIGNAHLAVIAIHSHTEQHRFTLPLIVHCFTPVGSALMLLYPLESKREEKNRTPML